MSQKKKTTAQSKRPRKAPSNQTGGTAWGKKVAAAISGKMQSADMKKLILLNFPYIIAFYMVEKAAWLYRHCNGDTIVDRLMVLFMNFGLAYKSYLPSVHPFDLLVGLIGAAALKAVIYFKGKNAKKYRQGEEYGSARWGNAKDIEPFIDPVFENNVLLTQTERLMMSGRPKHPKYARNKNVIVIGGSGSGKTRFFVKPNLMQMPEKVSYLWNEARDQWLVDPEAAEVVKRIFAMTIDGYGPYQIASKLKEEKVLIPSAYLARHGEGVNKNKTFKDVYGWGSSTICNILEKREYLGHTINFKTRKHFKDKKSHYVPEDEWTIFENTHEPIIDQQTFDLVQKIRGNVRRYPDGWGETAPLTGLLYCADCGGKMYVHRTNNGKRISQYTCSQYSKVPVGKLCKTQHRINEDVVLSLVSEMLKAIAEYAKHDRAEFVRVVQEAQSSQQTAEVRKQRTRLATAKQRVSELEVLLCKIYEDNILGKLSDSRYATLDAQYEKEQSELTAEISVLEKAVKSYEKHEKDADRFIALIDKYENFDKLTIAMLNEFIEKILVHERDRKGSIQTTQEVEIYFNFVGRFVPPAFGEVELTPEELEEIRKREERKDRLHQNYLKRKASGAQKRYEDKIKGRKKAEIEAKKAAIRAEDIAKGVFVPASSLPQREPMKGVQTA